MDIHRIQSKIAELAIAYGMDMVILFGSRADNTATKNSDVDIAYTRKTPVSFDDQLSFGSELAGLFGTENIDVVYLNTTSPAFMYQIMKKGKPLFSTDPTMFPNLFSYAIKRLHENMFLYDLKFTRLCREYGV